MVWGGTNFNQKDPVFSHIFHDISGLASALIVPTIPTNPSEGGASSVVNHR